MTAATETDGDPTILYRLYDADGTLLYIGITSNIAARFAQHAGDKPWWPEVARKTVVLYGSRPAALAAEDKAIRTELPLHNVRQAPVRGVRRASYQTEGGREATLEQVRIAAAVAAAARVAYSETMDRLRASIRAADQGGEGRNDIVRAAGGGMSRRKVYGAFRFEPAEITRTQP